MSSYPNEKRPAPDAGATAAVTAVILIVLLLVGGLTLGGFFYFRVQQKQMFAREAAMRAEAIAAQEQAEVERARAEMERERAEAELVARQQAEESRILAETAKREAEKARVDLERLQADMGQLDVMPEDSRTNEPETADIETTDLLVHLNDEGGVYIDQEPKDWEQIATILDDLKNAPRGRVVIVADKECRMEPVLRLMQLAKLRELNVTVSTREFNDPDAR